ncbi:archaea-specific SMC-related protein [Halobacterium zhouii]|uniref:archaea-specific SMC-related protein n=1 Tax=Halobacterium zhouii TaxID=2902624 RepID=UPI001E5339AF|nr:archaea-specific SMC-related protein [Halobacterium zhouii]
MDESADRQPGARLHARNVGGIEEATVALEPGVNVLEGRNATNRTSFLQSVMAALGSRNASLKGDAEEGRVELDLHGERYERTLTRVDGDVVFGGDGVLDDPDLADLFAFLLESNEARRAVEHGDDLREIIVRPVDTASLHAEIERLEDEKREIDSTLADLEDVASRQANREQRVDELESERADVRERLADAREDLDDADDAGESPALEELKEARADLEDLRFRLRTERESLESLRDQRADLEAERDSLPEGDTDVDALDDRIDDLRGEREELESTVNDLQGIIRFNEEMLEDASAVGGALADGQQASGEDHRSDGGTVTDALVADSEERVCWTCGTTVATSRIEETVDQLTELREQKLSRKSDVADELEALTERRREAEATRERYEEVTASIEDVEDEIEEREARVADLEDEREELETTVADLEAATEADDEAGTALETAKRVNELEVELERVESDLADARETVAELTERLAEREDLEERRAEVVAELTSLRERVDRVEENAVEAFNDHMETVLDLLAYDNIERIWIERTTTTVREGRETVERSDFDLHVVRASDGAAYEDSVDHLSESEREVTGLIFALAGYLVHNLHETVPFVLLDSLEAIDSERVAALVEYVAEHAEFLVVALLPEDAAAVDCVDNRVEEI